MEDFLKITLECPAFDTERVSVARLEGRETLGRIFELEAYVLTANEHALSADDLRGQTICVVISENGEVQRRVWGTISAVVEHLRLDTEYCAYDLRIVPRLHRMQLVHTQDILLDMSWTAAIEEKLSRVGLTEASELRLDGDYPEREFIVQHGETDLTFVSRLAEHLGITFFFEHGEDEERVVFSDHNEAFPEHPTPIPFGRFSERHDIYSMKVASEVIPSTVVLQDYNYRTPTADLTATSDVEGGSGGGVVEYGAHYFTQSEGEALAKVRAEEIRARQLVYEGESARPELYPGLRIEVEGHAGLADTALLITEVRHHAHQNVMGQGSDEPSHYGNTFRAIPADRTYRPPRRTPKPRLTGFYTGLIQPVDAHVVGPSAQLDPEGRYRVRMLFDIAPREGWVSHPIRMAQPHSGAGHGMHFPLRPGVEVAIVFANGDPDRPIILGALDNPVTPSPTTQRNARQNIVSTASGITITLRDNR